jgi:high-affinity iron transporter
MYIFPSAILVAIALIIPLAVLSKDLNDTTIMIIEGISKVVASICILQLSVKIPAWLGLYWKVSILPWKNNEIKHTDSDVISFNEIRFNVAWNIWREVAECGVFLIPFFLGSGAKAIPVSALAGVAVALVLGFGIFTANNRLKSKVSLAFFMSALTLFLATGLFVGGCHEFEEVWGETSEVWAIENPNMSAKELPMAIFKPFGYSSSRTVLQLCTFWLFLSVGLAFHTLKYRGTKDMQQRYAAAYPEKPEATQDIEKQSEGTVPKSEEEIDEAPALDENAASASPA